MMGCWVMWLAILYGGVVWALFGGRFLVDAFWWAVFDEDFLYGGVVWRFLVGDF